MGGLVIGLYVAAWVLAFAIAVATFVVTVRANIAVLTPGDPALRVLGGASNWLHWSLSYPVVIGMMGWSTGAPVVTKGIVDATDFLMPGLFLVAMLVLGAAVLAYVRSEQSR